MENRGVEARPLKVGGWEKRAENPGYAANGCCC